MKSPLDDWKYYYEEIKPVRKYIVSYYRPLWVDRVHSFILKHYKGLK